MKSGRSANKTAVPRRALSQLASSGATGVLRVHGAPGGTLYLTGGRVTYAESPASPDVGDLLTASGRLSAYTWGTTVDAGRAECRVGRLLVEHGHLTQGELELCVLGAVYDAAYFALQPAAAPVQFTPDESHWLGAVTQVDVPALSRETTRRRRLLDEIHAEATVDTAPVSLVARPPMERVVLTAAQWDLVVHADGRRTAAELARLLGRAGYATVQDLRRLAAAGLIEAGGGQSPGRHTGTAAGDRVLTAVTAGPATEATSTAANGSRPTNGDADGAAGATLGRITGARRMTGMRQAAIDRAPGEGLPRLPRRRPGARLPGGERNDAPAHSGPDEALLSRIRTALKGLR